jgi:hypothetical protein
MLPSFISSSSNSVLGLTLNIYLDADFNEYQIRSTSGVVLFKATSKEVALFGIETYHAKDYCGLTLTKNDIQ